MEYYIHVSLDAVSLDDLDKWGEISKEIEEIFKGKEKLPPFPWEIEGGLQVGSTVKGYGGLDWDILVLMGRML